jgi:hypothetical protein
MSSTSTPNKYLLVFHAFTECCIAKFVNMLHAHLLSLTKELLVRLLSHGYGSIVPNGTTRAIVPIEQQSQLPKLASWLNMSRTRRHLMTQYSHIVQQLSPTLPHSPNSILSLCSLKNALVHAKNIRVLTWVEVKPIWKADVSTLGDQVGYKALAAPAMRPVSQASVHYRGGPLTYDTSHESDRKTCMKQTWRRLPCIEQHL